MASTSRKRPRRADQTRTVPLSLHADASNKDAEWLRRRVEELERYTRELEGRLAENESERGGCRADKTKDDGGDDERATCETCGQALPLESEGDDGVGDDGSSKDQRTTISLADLERETPHPVGEAQDPLPVIDGRADSLGSFAQKCNWLRAYKREHGHCDVPHPKSGVRHERYHRLMDFVQRIRRQYNSERRGTPRRGARRLTPDRIRTLEDIGLKWVVYLRPDFDEMYEELRAFYCRRGHCCVGSVPEDERECDSRLHGWTNEVRTCLRALARSDEYLAGTKDQRSFLVRARRFINEEQREVLEGLDCPWLHEGRNLEGKNGDNFGREKEQTIDGVGNKGDILEVGKTQQDESTSKKTRKEATDGNISACSLEAEEIDAQGASSATQADDELATKGPSSASTSNAKYIRAKSGEAWSTWFKRFEEAQRYKAQHGHLFVDTIGVRKCSLGGWVREHRKVFKRVRGGEREATAVEDYRLRKLEGLGVVFDAEILRRRDEEMAQERARRKEETRGEEEKARMERIREAASEAEQALQDAELKFEATKRELEEAKERAQETKRKQTEEVERAAKNPVGKLARVAPRGKSKRGGIAEVVFFSSTVVVGETLSFYTVRWPDGKKETGVEGTHVTVLFTEDEVEKAKEEIYDEERTRPTISDTESEENKLGRHLPNPKSDGNHQCDGREGNKPTDMKGKDVIVLPRGGGKRIGSAKIDVMSKAKVLNKELTYYSVVWPDGKRETAIEGRFIHVLMIGTDRNH